MTIVFGKWNKEEDENRDNDKIISVAVLWNQKTPMLCQHLIIPETFIIVNAGFNNFHKYLTVHSWASCFAQMGLAMIILAFRLLTVPLKPLMFAMRLEGPGQGLLIIDTHPQIKSDNYGETRAKLARSSQILTNLKSNDLTDSCGLGSSFSSVI